MLCWRLAVSFVLRLGALIPGVPVSAVSSEASLGASFCPFWGYLASSRAAGGTSGFGSAAFCDSVSALVAFTPLVVNSLLDSWPAAPLYMFPVSHL